MKRLSKILALAGLIVSFTFNTAFAYPSCSKSNISIKWFGHSSFGISDSRGMEIVTDPYSEDIGYTFPKNLSTDILTVSHQHFDHNNIEALQSYSHYIQDLGKFKFDKIEVKGIASYHDEEKGALRGPNTIYTYKIDNIKICHLGDLGHLLTLKEILQIGKVDVLMIPVGGLYTIDAEAAAKVVKQLNPKIVIPMHYKTAALIDDFGPVDKVDKFLSVMKGWKVKKLDVLNINKDVLMKSKDKTIAVLSYK